MALGKFPQVLSQQAISRFQTISGLAPKF
jgi:hypothetical protein